MKTATGQRQALRTLPGFRGRLLYLHADGAAWGFEDWTIRHGRDGRRTLVAHCELEFDGLRVARDVLQTVDAGCHPQDASVRLMVDDEVYGSAWYRFTDDLAECESWSVSDGRSAQRFPIDRTLRGFGTHALQSDAWLLMRFDYQRGGTQPFRRNLVTSLHHFGATGPRFMTTDTGLELVGAETISVPAGTFDCWRLRFVGMKTQHPQYDLWVTRDGHFIYVRGTVAGYMDSTFELVELAPLPEQLADGR
jgi:hypothetical protein